MKCQLGRFISDDGGAETAEWILTVAIILAIGRAVLVGALQPELGQVIVDSAESAITP